MGKNEKYDGRVVCTGIIALAALEMAALYNGINGTLFTIVVAVIGAAIGVTIPNPIKQR
jgi:hypothetical protein